MVSSIITKPWKYILMEPDKDDAEDVIQMSREPSAIELTVAMRRLLGAEHYEHVYVLYQGKQRDMFIDEFSHRKHLPLNVSATKIYRAATLRRKPNTIPASLPVIVGPAVLFARRVWR